MGCDRDSATYYENTMSSRATDRPRDAAAVLPGCDLGPSWGPCVWVGLSEAGSRMALKEAYFGGGYVYVAQGK